LSRNAGHCRRRWRTIARGLRRWAGAGLALALWAMRGVAQDAVPQGMEQRSAGRFTVVSVPSDSLLAQMALREAQTRDSFPSLPRSAAPVLIAIAPDTRTFAAWAGPIASDATAAVAIVASHRIVMRGRGAPPNIEDPRQVLRHELAHVALYDYFGRTAPRWFEEGYASYAAAEERTTGFLATNAAMLFRRLPSLAGVDSLLISRRVTESRAGYALALRAVHDLAALDPEQGLTPLLHAWKERGTFDLALRRSAALTAEQFETQWQQRTRWQFAFLALVTDSALFALVGASVLLPLYWRRRREYAKRMTALRVRDAADEEARRAAVLDAAARAIGTSAAVTVADP
jgi:hypothetical protein